MPTTTVYRYDSEYLTEGQQVHPRGDPFDTLTDDQKQVEREIRATLPNGEIVRSTSLYAWEDEAVARRLWPHSKRKYLYELEIEQSNIRLKADLNFYSEAVDAIKEGRSPIPAVEKYCSGESADPSSGLRRIEILVTEAKVIRRFA